MKFSACRVWIKAFVLFLNNMEVYDFLCHNNTHCGILYVNMIIGEGAYFTREHTPTILNHCYAVSCFSGNRVIILNHCYAVPCFSGIRVTIINHRFVKLTKDVKDHKIKSYSKALS